MSLSHVCRDPENLCQQCPSDHSCHTCAGVRRISARSAHPIIGVTRVQRSGEYLPEVLIRSFVSDTPRVPHPVFPDWILEKLFGYWDCAQSEKWWFPLALFFTLALVFCLYRMSCGDHFILRVNVIYQQPQSLVDHGS